MDREQDAKEEWRKRRRNLRCYTSCDRKSEGREDFANFNFDVCTYGTVPVLDIPLLPVRYSCTDPLLNTSHASTGTVRVYLTRVEAATYRTVLRTVLVVPYGTVFHGVLPPRSP